jgi:hypothetical protein
MFTVITYPPTQEFYPHRWRNNFIKMPSWICKKQKKIFFSTCHRPIYVQAFHIASIYINSLENDSAAWSVPKELFYIERGCNSRTEIRERETKCKTTCIQAASSTRTNLFSPLPALPLPLSHPPPINVIRGASLRPFRPPPSPTHALPVQDFSHFWRPRPKTWTASI